VTLDINGTQHPIGSAIEVASKPSSIHLVAQGNNIPLDQHRAQLWYKNHLTSSSIQFTEGPLGDVLERLQGLPEEWFVLSFEMNRSKKIYDRQTIMMKPLPREEPDDAIWVQDFDRGSTRRWRQICQDAKSLESDNFDLLSAKKNTILPEKLRQAVDSYFSEMVAWLTNYKRQRE
jgi:hypothetical protein